MLDGTREPSGGLDVPEMLHHVDAPCGGFELSILNDDVGDGLDGTWPAATHVHPGPAPLAESLVWTARGILNAFRDVCARCGVVA